MGKSMETETAAWSEFVNGGKAVVEQTLDSEEINQSRRVGLKVIVRYLSRNVNHLSKVIGNRKFITELKSICFTRIG